MNASRGLRLLGERIPEGKAALLWSLLKESFLHYLKVLIPVGRSGLSEDERMKYSIIINMYMTLDWMYILSDTLKFVRSVFRMLNLSRSRLGVSAELGMSVAVFGSFLMVLPSFKRANRYHERALRMRQELEDQTGIAQSMQFMGYSYCYQGEYSLSMNFFRQSEEIFARMGDVWETAMVLNGMGYNALHTGNLDAMIDSFTRYLDLSEKGSDYYGTSVARTNLSLAYALRGDLEKAALLGESALALSGEKELWYPHCFANINQGIVMMERGDYDDAVRYFEIARWLFMENNFLKDYTVHLFPNLVDSYLEIFRYGRTRVARSMIGKLCRESLRRTRRWPNHHAASLRVAGKLYTMTGNFRKAEKYYRRSIRHSALLGKRFDLAKGLYEYGIMLREKGSLELAEARLRTAREIFREIGAALYVGRIESLLDIPREEEMASIRSFMDRQRMYSIIRVSQDISSIMNLDELLEKVMAVAIEVTGAQRGYLMIADENTRTLSVAAGKNVNILDRGEDMEFAMAIAGEVHRTGEAVLTMNAMADERFARYRAVARHGLKSILCIPLKYKDEVMGACYLDNPLSGSVFTSEDQDLLGIIMTQAAISIDNVRLYELGITDGMTKLVTHAHFQNLLQKEISKASRYDRKVSLIMIDIDHFKAFNDTHGHQAGDEVLKSISRMIKENCRNIDIAARYGGEELVMVLPETPPEEALTVAERVLDVVRSGELEYQGKLLKVTISVGVATFPEHASDRVSLIRAADEALYRSKAEGRDRVTLYVPGGEPRKGGVGTRAGNS